MTHQRNIRVNEAAPRATQPSRARLNGRARSGSPLLAAALAVALFAALSTVLGTPALANHSVYLSLHYPDVRIGFFSMSKASGYSGTLWVDHNSPGCGAVETNRSHEVWMNVHNSTRGQSSFTRWVNGVDMVNNGCAGTESGVKGSVFNYESNLFDTAVGWDKTQADFDQGNEIGRAHV